MPRVPRSAMQDKPCLLVTGFEPFGADTVNPSWLAARSLHGRILGGHEVVAACLPTEFGRSFEVLDLLIQRHAPTLILCTGQAGGRGALSLERVAINVDDARIPDNAGAQPVDTPVVAGAPAAYFSTLPIKAMFAAIQSADLPVEISQTAGTFVCNHVFFAMMHALATRPELAGTRAGLVHVPWMHGQGVPSMSTEQVVAGLETALTSALHVKDDLLLQAGALC